MGDKVLTGRRKIHKLIRDEIAFDAMASNERVAQRVLRHVNKDDLLPLLIDEVGTLQRQHTRSRERRVIVSLFETLGKRKTKRPPAERQKLVNDMYSQLHSLRARNLDLGNGERVKWGELTIEQATTRLAMLRRQVSGLSTTIRNLEMVVDVLETTGATCLDELAFAKAS